MPFNLNFFMSKWLAISSFANQFLSNPGALFKYFQRIKGNFGSTFSIL